MGEVEAAPADVEDDIADDADLEAAVIAVLAGAVLRVLKNPDGFKQEQLDDWAGTRDAATSAGALFFTDEELSGLIPGGNGRRVHVDLLAGYLAPVVYRG